MPKRAKLYHTVSSVVGTLNDDDVACSIDFFDETGKQCSMLEETPEISIRKNRMRHDLLGLKAQFLNQEHLLIAAYFITNNNRNIDATNVLDLVQNAGQGVAWNNDKQFKSVHCDRVVNKYLPANQEKTVIYVAEIIDINNLSLRCSLQKRIAAHFDKIHNEPKYLSKLFHESEIEKYYQSGFWQDDRFHDVLPLADKYNDWLAETSKADLDDEILNLL